MNTANVAAAIPRRFRRREAAALHEAPPPAIDDPSHQSYHHHDLHPIVPDEPPPSYDEVTRLESAPLLVGPPPDYGAFTAYGDPETSTVASSEAEGTDRSFAEYVGQFFVLIVLGLIVYAFWKVIDGATDINHPPW